MSRTFSMEVDTRRGITRQMVNDDTSVIIRADPIHTRTEKGETISIGFPVLIVTGWVNEPEAFAAKVVERLNGAGL